MGSNYDISMKKYCVDIVMCIDGTGSMGSLLDTVKANALSFYTDLTKRMAEKGRNIDELRVKVIIFRDYLADGKNAMLGTDFLTLPAQSAEFRNYISGIEPFGGGDDPEDGLEALAYAMKSKWTTASKKRRHIIIVWTDEETHQLGFGQNPENGRYLVTDRFPWSRVQENASLYPPRMAKSFDELTDWWGDSSTPGVMDNNAKRLLIYAPDLPYWSTISNTWDNVLHFPSEAGKGLEGLEYREILDAIANSI